MAASRSIDGVVEAPAGVVALGPPVEVAVDVTAEVAVDVTVDVAVDVTLGDVDGAGDVVEVVAHVTFVNTLLSSVTEPFRASARPWTVAPLLAVIEVRAKIVPTKLLSVPSVADEPTCQNTWQLCALLSMTTELLVAVVRSDPIREVIENLFDQPEQVATSRGCDRRSLGGHRRGVHLPHLRGAAHGVLSSWLNRARKAGLARVACSAASSPVASARASRSLSSSA